MNGLFRPEWSTLKKLMFLQSMGGEAWSTISGNPVSFTAKAAPLRQLKVAFSPVQDLHGYDSPWPAGGGKNKWDEEWENGTFDTTTGANINYGSMANQIRAKNKIPVTPDATYYFVFPLNASGQGLWVIFYDENDAVIPYEQLPQSYAHDGNSILLQLTQKTLTIPSDCHSIRFYVTNTYGATYNHNIAINYPSSVTTYSPYSNECPISGWSSLTVYHSGADTSNPQTISISLGETVYSGYVDVVTGVVTVTHKSRTFSGSDSWNGSNPGTNANLSISDMASGSHYSDQFAICDTLPKVSVISGTTPEVRIGASNTSVYLYNMSSVDASITSSATLNTYLASHPIMITYPLATPLTIQLTPQEVQSLAGDNVLFSDANGDLTVTYRSN